MSVVMMKYTLSSTETKKVNGYTLHKIEYSEEFKQQIKEKYGINLEGGWIESENNLSQDGDAMVYGDARVFGDARVCGDARVSDDAKVFGDARIFGSATASQG